MAKSERTASGPISQIVVLPFAADVSITGAWQKISTVVVTIPKVLISYYDQRVTAVLAGELMNAEAALCLFDNAFNPINGQRLCIIGGLTQQFTRYGSQLADLSPFFRTGQVQCLGVQARATVSGGVARNLTAILYLGTVTIGRQAT